MKRKIAIATVTAAALIGTGTLSAAARADDGGKQETSSVRTDDRDDARSATTTAAEAAATANKAAPGTVTGIDLDDGVWEVEVTKDGTSHETRLDAKTGKVLGKHKEDDDDDTAPANPKVSAADAAEKASDRGTVTSVDLDDNAWEVETEKNGKEQELSIDLTSGKVTAQTSDDDD